MVHWLLIQNRQCIRMLQEKNYTIKILSTLGFWQTVFGFIKKNYGAQHKVLRQLLYFFSPNWYYNLKSFLETSFFISSWKSLISNLLKYIFTTQTILLLFPITESSRDCHLTLIQNSPKERRHLDISKKYIVPHISNKV